MRRESGKATSEHDLLRAIDKSRMCVTVRRDSTPGTARRKFEIEGWWRQNILCSLDRILHDILHPHQNDF